MTLPPRAVLVHRRTELQELVERHSTRGQAAFYLRTRGRRIEDLEVRHEAVEAAIGAVTSVIPADWRRGMVERADLPRFQFAPDDIIVAVGQDGLVANIAKYLDGQLVIGIDPEPGRNPGVLVSHSPSAAADLLSAAAGRPGAAAGPGAGARPGRRSRRDVPAGHRVDRLTMVVASTDDGQQITALNEIYLGQPTHQTARYRLRLPDGQAEAQASSGLIVATGTGATGWCRSAWLERKSSLVLPAPAERRLSWFIREAWPSPATGTALTEGSLAVGQALTVSAESDQLVLFGDGVEADTVPLTWGQTATVGLADRSLNLLR
jgi:NAD kinase